MHQGCRTGVWGLLESQSQGPVRLHSWGHTQATIPTADIPRLPWGTNGCRSSFPGRGVWAPLPVVEPLEGILFFLQTSTGGGGPGGRAEEAPWGKRASWRRLHGGGGLEAVVKS